MLTIVTAAQAAKTEDGGWAHLIALGVAGLIFWAGTKVYERWEATRRGPSPVDDPKALGTVKPQVKGDSDSDDSGRGVAVYRPTSLDEELAAKAGKRPATALVRETARRLKKSEATVWRAYRRVTKGGAQ